MGNRTAVIVVDVQKDFCEGGSLPVTGGNRVAEDIASFVRDMQDDPHPPLIVFTKDFHDPDSDNGGHFAETPDFVDTWPVHCVRDSGGSEFHPAISEVAGNYPLFLKGQGKPAYSGFEGALGRVLGRDVEETDMKGARTLADFLRTMGIKEVAVCGLAADYCVKATALDAVKEGFKTYLMPSLTASIATPVLDVAKQIEGAQV